MTCTADVFGAAAELDHGNNFGDQFRCSMMQDVAPENAIGFGVGDELDHSFHIINAKRTAIGAKWKFANPDVDPLLFGLVLGETDAGELRIGVNDPGNGFV